jgi:hypothetical protein
MTGCELDGEGSISGTYIAYFLFRMFRMALKVAQPSVSRPGTFLFSVKATGVCLHFPLYTLMSHCHTVGF